MAEYSQSTIVLTNQSESYYIKVASLTTEYCLDHLNHFHLYLYTSLYTRVYMCMISSGSDVKSVLSIKTTMVRSVKHVEAWVEPFSTDRCLQVINSAEGNKYKEFYTFDDIRLVG